MFVPRLSFIFSIFNNFLITFPGLLPREHNWDTITGYYYDFITHQSHNLRSQLLSQTRSSRVGTISDGHRIAIEI